MRLQRLTALEADKIKEEHAELVKEIKRAARDPRRRVEGARRWSRRSSTRSPSATATSAAPRSPPPRASVDIEDVIADQQMVISITASGYAKRLPLATYRQQRRGGRGVMGMNLKEGDYIEHLHVCSTHDYLLFFTNKGKVYRLKVYELPEGARTAKGRALVNVLPLQGQGAGDGGDPDPRLQRGQVPRLRRPPRGWSRRPSSRTTTPPIKAAGLVAIKIRKGDELVQVRLTSGKDDIIMVSKSGHAARFNEKLARPMGRGTSGVKGMNVADKGNQVLSLDVARDEDELLRRHRERLRQAHRDRPSTRPRAAAPRAC